MQNYPLKNNTISNLKETRINIALLFCDSWVTKIKMLFPKFRFPRHVNVMLKELFQKKGENDVCFLREIENN